MGKQSPERAPSSVRAARRAGAAQPSWLWAAFPLEQKVFPELVIPWFAFLPSCAGMILPAAALLPQPCPARSIAGSGSSCGRNRTGTFHQRGATAIPGPARAADLTIQPQKQLSLNCKSFPAGSMWHAHISLQGCSTLRAVAPRGQRQAGDTARAAPERGHAAAEGSGAQVWGEEAEGAGDVPPGQKRLSRNLIMLWENVTGGCSQMGVDLPGIK